MRDRPDLTAQRPRLKPVDRHLTGPGAAPGARLPLSVKLQPRPSRSRGSHSVKASRPVAGSQRRKCSTKATDYATPCEPPGAVPASPPSHAGANARTGELPPTPARATPAADAITTLLRHRRRPDELPAGTEHRQCIHADLVAAQPVGRFDRHGCGTHLVLRSGSVVTLICSARRHLGPRAPGAIDTSRHRQTRTAAAMRCSPRPFVWAAPPATAPPPRPGRSCPLPNTSSGPAGSR
ncbi:hypothetical protein L1887_47187 [Cichorium endivia]|nr:hypothetical protein L1887_47187 [Cichorium endivia]